MQLRNGRGEMTWQKISLPDLHTSDSLHISRDGRTGCKYIPLLYATSNRKTQNNLSVEGVCKEHDPTMKVELTNKRGLLYYNERLEKPTNATLY